MPIHQLRTISDAEEVVARYGLRGVAIPLHEPERLWDLRDFSNWLFVRTNSVSSQELKGYIDEFDNLFPIDPAAAQARKRVIQVNAEDAMRGVQSYERRAHDLMWIIRELRATVRGRHLLDVMAAMATSTSVMETYESRSEGGMQPLEAAMIAISRLGTFDPSTKYRPGDQIHTDFFIRLDINRLDETLANESQWRDDENMLWPVEVCALAAAAAIFVEEVTKQRNAAPAQ